MTGAEISMPDKQLTALQLDRAMGALLGLACGDALGAPYEFLPRVPYTTPIGMVGGNRMRWAPGEWTDDTAMAHGIASVAATGIDVRSVAAQDQIARNWWTWADGAVDIGRQISAVLGAAEEGGTAKAMRAAAVHYHQDNAQRSAGNGALMRTAPVALAYLGDDDEATLWQAAQEIAALTHFERDAQEACALWCLAIRHAVLFGSFDGLRLALARLDAEPRALWSARLDEAERKQSWQFPNNGWTVAALQAAWSAIVHTGESANRPDLGFCPAQHAPHEIERAVRCGGDTDTVGAIAGALVGARWGASALPQAWLTKLHGWPDAKADDLKRLALLTVTAGGSAVLPPTVGLSAADIVPTVLVGGQLNAVFQNGLLCRLYLLCAGEVFIRRGAAWLKTKGAPMGAQDVDADAIAVFDEAEMSGQIEMNKETDSAQT